MRKVVRPLLVLSFLLLALGVVPARAQERAKEAWTVGPVISISKVFPGAEVEGEPVVVFDGPSYAMKWQYEGGGLAVSARGFSSSFKPLVFYLSGGVYWYTRADEAPTYSPMPASNGIGKTMGARDFMSFPIAVGVELVVPYEEQEKVMGFIGLHGTANFISGEVNIGQQVKMGYEVVGGFAVKVFECGIRYSGFSDMRNLGAYLGFRLNSFTM